MEQTFIQSKIEELQGKLKQNRTHSPFIVEFTGLPKSGKTTIINRLENVLDTHKLRVHVIEEAATEKVDSKHRSDLFVFNMLCALENLNGVLRASTMRGNFDVVLMDRGVYDSIVWCAFLEKSGLLSPGALRILNQFFSMQQWFSKIDLLVHMGVNRDTYLARSRINCPVTRPARFNEEYFGILSEAYVDAEGLLRKVPEATRPELLQYDSSVNLSSGRDGSE
ncbi:MAG: hypothetical protein JWR15_3946 [Prosthecobacter sp.]|nr:hypothetical protein [Prosthecobacter sp.]